MRVAITGRSAHVPGLTAQQLPGSPAEPAVGAHDAHTVLGRKGLLAKEPATRLALCAVHEAFGLHGKQTSPLPGAAGTAVVVASNLGNAATVCAMVDSARAGGGVSPLEAPNASSNVIASTIAIRYGFTGPNLMVCSGATAGLDAVRLGALLVRSGRTHRAVVVGVEPDDDIATGLVPGLRAAAACVVLTPHTGGEAVLLGGVRRGRHRVRGLDLSAVGETYGAEGVLQVAVGSVVAAGTGTDVVAACGAAADGFASVTLSPVSARELAGVGVG
ncbi:beta-ketoacyl synthase [Actinokineospora sp. PR83]|uniref:beta-ketoacyl synthase N-terminal-like domain-containing protein n=1 Tax=Actinokineospora sp. PR83 TaxID=2884908 RepID=UPI001F21B37C|nr:beta-ketoacyl synthase N-terminal-like domain-containing protein [Actinokineospora sp. PR83]MCG8914802.1 beta-ketoacyl synthase [Actinokineospora sp. PR83]